jgi:hypothetical protein
VKVPGAAASSDGFASADGIASADEIASAAEALRGAGAALRERPADEIARALGSVGERFLRQGDPLREAALGVLPESAGLSREMATAVLDGMAKDWTVARLRELLEREFEDPRCLDGFTTSRGRRLMAVGPSLCAQVVAGSVPGVSVHALIRSLLVKGPTLVKPGLGDLELPRLFATGLSEEDAALAEAVRVLYWKGGSEDKERAAFAGADVVVGYGSDASIEALRARLPATARFVSYHHRVGFAVVGRQALAGDQLPRTARQLAGAVALFEQRGCVSPHVVFVEARDEEEVESFAVEVAHAFEELEGSWPGPALDAHDGAALQQLRKTAELRAATGGGAVWHGGSEATWTVVHERRDVEWGASCFARAVRVRGVERLAEVAEQLGPLGDHLQTIGYAGISSDELEGFAAAMGSLGASRVVPIGDVALPPPWWLHDGRPPLRELVRWVELGATPPRRAAARHAR